MDGNYEITDLNVTGAGKILKMKVNGKGVDVVTDITKNEDDEITAISINGTSQEIAGGDSDIEENKEATIDVSTYTEPVEIVPTEGKDGMEKVTVTLDNIPPGKLFAYGTAEGAVYLQFLPEGDIENLAVLVPSTTGLAFEIGSYTEEGDKITLGSTDYARYTAGDIEL